MHVPRVREFCSLKYWAGQILYCTALQTVCHCFSIYASIPVYVALTLWRWNEYCKLVTSFIVLLYYGECNEKLKENIWKISISLFITYCVDIFPV